VPPIRTEIAVTMNCYAHVIEELAGTERRPAEAVIRDARDESANLMPAIDDAVRARCTLGEICTVLRDEWGTYRPPTAF
jgi:methylmalonyl-CoA mutase, N-terminal domain